MPQAWGAIPVRKLARLGEQVRRRRKGFTKQNAFFSQALHIGRGHSVAVGLNKCTGIMGMHKDYIGTRIT